MFKARVTTTNGMRNEKQGTFENDYSNQMFEFKASDISRCVGAAHKVSPNWSLETMTCHSSHCFSIVWG